MTSEIDVLHETPCFETRLSNLETIRDIEFPFFHQVDDFVDFREDLSTKVLFKPMMKPILCNLKRTDSFMQHDNHLYSESDSSPDRIMCKRIQMKPTTFNCFQLEHDVLISDMFTQP